MAFQTIDRKSELFTPDVSDEINKIISDIDDRIDNLYAPVIAYKLSLTDVYVRLLRYKDVLHLDNQSIRIEEELRIHLEFTVKKTGTIEGKLAKSPFKMASSVPILAASTKSKLYNFVIKQNGDITINASNVEAGEIIVLEYVTVL